MILSEEDKNNFLKFVCPESRSLAEDLIDGKIDALYIGYEYVGYDVYTYKMPYIKKHGVLGQAYIGIFENSMDEPSKVIMLNVTRQNIRNNELYITQRIVYKYGNSWEYDLLVKSDTDDELRWELLEVYARDCECSFILKKKFKKIYESLSDSDKLLLELSDDDITWYTGFR